MFVDNKRAFGSKGREGFVQPVTSRFSGHSIEKSHVDRSEVDRIEKDRAAHQHNTMDACDTPSTASRL